jgi:hypothetical protein
MDAKRQKCASAEGWRKLHNEELHNLFSSPNIIKVPIMGDKRGGTCGTHDGEEKSIQSYVGEA